MAYAPGTLRYQVQGTIGGIQDFSYGLSFQTTLPGSPSYANLVTWLGQVQIPYATYAGAIAVMSSTAVSYLTHRVEYYDGGQRAALVANGALGAAVVGTGSPTNSSRAALVASLITDRPGRSFMGRVYVPCLNPAIQATTRVDASRGALLRTSLRAFILAIEALPLPTSLGSVAIDAVVASRTLGSSQSITALRTDDLLDTQRRRENDFTPNYSSTVL